MSSYFRDPDGDALSYETGSSDASVATASVSGSTVTVTAVAQGSATVTVTARDPAGLSATQNFGVTVARANRAPEAVGSIPPVGLAAGESATFEVSSYFRDPDGDALSYETGSSDALGGYGVRVGLDGDGHRRGPGERHGDGDGARPGGTVRHPELRCHGWRVPTALRRRWARSPPVGLAAGESATFEVSSYFRDPDGDALSYETGSSDASVATASVSGSTVTVTAVAQGSATVTVTARDPAGTVRHAERGRDGAACQPGAGGGGLDPARGAGGGR